SREYAPGKNESGADPAPLSNPKELVERWVPEVRELILELGRNGAERAGDATGERGQRGNDHKGNDGEHDCILGHRLAAVAPGDKVEPGHEIVHFEPPWWCTPRG